MPEKVKFVPASLQLFGSLLVLLTLQLGQFLQWLHAQHPLISLFPVGLLPRSRIVVITVLLIVLVQNLGHVLDAAHARQLSQAVLQGIVVHRVQPAARRVLVVAQRYMVEQLDSPGTDGSNQVATPPLAAVQQQPVHAPQNLRAPISIEIGFEVGVDDPSVSFAHCPLVDCVDDGEGMAADELVVAVQQHLDITFLAQVVGGIDYVIGCVHSLPVLDKGDPFLLELVPVDGLADQLHGGLHIVIIGVVINKDNMEILILLLHDGVHAFPVSPILHIVVAEHSEAHGHLLLLCLVTVDVVDGRKLEELQVVQGVVYWQVRDLLTLECLMELLGIQSLLGVCPDCPQRLQSFVLYGRVDCEVLRQLVQPGVRGAVVGLFCGPLAHVYLQQQTLYLWAFEWHLLVLVLTEFHHPHCQHLLTSLALQQFHILAPKIICVQQLENSAIEGPYLNNSFLLLPLFLDIGQPSPILLMD